MNYNSEQILMILKAIAPNQYLQAVLIIVIFIIAAKIVDFILLRVISRLLKKTEIAADDKILEIFHKPIFISIIVFGLTLAANQLNYPEIFRFVTTGILQTMVNAHTKTFFVG